MTTLIQDSIAGHAFRILSNGRFFKYAEERDPSLWKRFTNIEKSGRMAYHGRTDSTDIPDGDTFDMDWPVSQIPSRAWSNGSRRFQGLTGVRIDPEKGKDVHLVDWWDENDPEVGIQSKLHS